MTLASYLGLLGAAIALAVVPGPDTLLTLRYALRSRRAGVLIALGATTSMLIWGLLAALGVVAILSASIIAYDVLTILGGAYIVVIGVRLVVGAVRLLRHATSTTPAPAPSSRRWVERAGPFLAGALSCITNPKVGVFFLALFPEFVPPGATWWYVWLVLGGTCAAAGLAYLLTIAFVADATNRWLARPTATAVVEGLSGIVLTVLGLLVLVPGIVALVTLTRA